MDFLNQPIKFYKKRNFSEKMSAAFDFVKANIKILLQLSLYLLLPVSLLQGIFMNTYIGTVFNLSTGLGQTASVETEMLMSILPSIMGSFLGIMILGLLGYALLISLTFTTIQEYNEKGSLKGIMFNDLKPRLIQNAKRALVVCLAIFGLAIAAYLLILLSAFIFPFLLIALIPAFIVFILPMTMIYPVYIFEDIKLSAAIVKGFRLGLKTWGPLFGIMFVMGLLAGVLQSVGAIPFSIFFFTKAILSVSDPTALDMTATFGSSIAMYITAVIAVFFSYVSYILIQLGVAYHYSSTVEADEAISVNDDLSNFEQL